MFFMSCKETAKKDKIKIVFHMNTAVVTTSFLRLQDSFYVISTKRFHIMIHTRHILCVATVPATLKFVWRLNTLILFIILCAFSIEVMIVQLKLDSNFDTGNKRLTWSVRTWSVRNKAMRCRSHMDHAQQKLHASESNTVKVFSKTTNI